VRLLTISGKNFRALVRGDVAELRDANDQLVRIVLEDFGFDGMIDAIRDAMTAEVREPAPAAPSVQDESIEALRPAAEDEDLDL
jgi:hypothetical protein